MSWDEVKKVNSDLGVPLNHIIWLNDYKTYGENSYVFVHKDILHELYRDYRITINDKKIRKEAMLYAESIGETGKALAQQYDCDLSHLRTYSTFEEINLAGDMEFCKETYLDNGKLRWLFDDGILTSTFYTASNVNMLVAESQIEGIETLIHTDAVTAWYADEANYAEITKGVDEAMKWYNVGGRLWGACCNQTYLKAIYDHENSNGNVRTISGVSSGSDGNEVTYGTISNTKALLRISANGPASQATYAYANVTNDGNSIKGSCIHDGYAQSSFAEGWNGFCKFGRWTGHDFPTQQEHYTFYPCDSVAGIVKCRGSFTGVQVSVSAV